MSNEVTFSMTPEDMIAARDRVIGQLEEYGAEWRRRALAAEQANREPRPGQGPQTDILRGEWLRQVEARQGGEYAMLATRSGSVSVLLDRMAVTRAVLALGGQVTW